jgi:phospholipase D1/2
MPLEPGYAMPVDHPDAGSVRLIMECQFNSISRGEHSIFARLRRDGIDPNEYISFYGLRNWARMQDGTLSTSGVSYFG